MIDGLTLLTGLALTGLVGWFAKEALTVLRWRAKQRRILRKFSEGVGG